MHCHNPCCLAVQLRCLGEWKLPQPDAEPHIGHFLQQRQQLFGWKHQLPLLECVQEGKLLGSFCGSEKGMLSAWELLSIFSAEPFLNCLFQ